MLPYPSRLLELWRIAAYYRLDTIFANAQMPPPAQKLAWIIRLHPAAWFSKQNNNPMRLKEAIEQMGPLFIKLGQLLSTRRDLIPPEILMQLTYLQDRVRPFDADIAKQRINNALGGQLNDWFSRFDDEPLAAASIAQVHSAQLKDGKEVVVKVTRPHLAQQITRDFSILDWLAAHAENRYEAAQALHLQQIMADYRQTMLNEVNLTLEAENATQMRKNFLNSGTLYVPEVYFSHPDAIIEERIYGVPVSDTATFEKLGINRAYLGELGLKIFFTQVLRDNFFHADMHPGNVFVDISTPQQPQYIALDFAIIGQLSDADRMTVARLLLAVMQSNFNQLVVIAHQAGWIPAGTDQFALAREMKRAVAPMISKPMDELDFALVLMQIMDIARRFKLEIPPQLTLLLKTLVHVEGLGRDLYPQLDIWKLAKPILADWIKEQMHPAKTIAHIKEQLPNIILGATDLPALITDSLHGLRQQMYLQDKQWRELKNIQRENKRSTQNNWIALIMLLMCYSIGQSLPHYGVVITNIVLLGILFWRLSR